MADYRDRMQFIYLIASGNDDGIYKIGLSVDPIKRLEQIKEQYQVPNAYIVETMDVPTRDEVFAVEQALHQRFKTKLSRKYSGKEWFRLTAKDILELKAMYRSDSNAFAQCSAFFGMVQERDKIKDQAQAQEFERIAHIRHNRRFGKTYDTKPKGVLKRFNDLQARIDRSLLGQRFVHGTVEHPALKLRKHIEDELRPVHDKDVGSVWPQLGLVGFFGGLMCAGILSSTAPSTVAVFTGVVGSVAGLVSRHGEINRRILLASDDAHQYVDSRYPHYLSAEMQIIKDTNENQAYLVKDFFEHQPTLRNQSPQIPRIQKHVPQQLVERYQGIDYFPTVGAIATCLTALALSGMTQANTQPSRQQSLLSPPPIVALYS